MGDLQLGEMTMDRNVLIVEDESIVAMELEEQVKGLECGVMGPVSTAAAALRLCEANVPDLVLMDIRIQGAQDGVEAAQALRRRFNVPVIYLTALADGITIERAKLTEPAGYLLKPVRADELKAAVEIAFYKSEMESILERQRAEFVSMLAHDIRSPLQAVLGFADLLADDLKESGLTDAGELLRRMRESLSHTTDVINNLLALINFEFGRVELAMTRLSVNDAIRKVKDRYAREASRRDLILETRLASDLPSVEADQLILERIFANLLVNALKFTPAGGRVTLSSEARGSYAVASVTNTGPVIASDDIPHLFERGWRGAADADKEGSGLGLYIVKTLVEMLGGKVEVESTMRSGTCFSVFLPTG
jgi:signal transduction histidine kinase